MQYDINSKYKKSDFEINKNMLFFDLEKLFLFK